MTPPAMLLSAAAQALTEAAGLDPGAERSLPGPAALAAELAELARDVRDYREALAADPERLQQSGNARPS